MHRRWGRLARGCHHARPHFSSTTLWQYFKIEKEQGIAHLILNRPEKLNTMTDAFFSELRRGVRCCDDDEGMRCIVVSAEGPHFTAGLDLKEAVQMFSQDTSLLSKTASPSEPGMPAMRNQRMYRLIRRWQHTISALHGARLPVIVAVHGKCIGAGVDLVTAADIRLCTADAEFSAREVQLGIVADLGTLHRLGRVVGQGIARELAFTGRTLRADRALRVGLVNEVYATKPELHAGALALAKEIASQSPLAVQGVKHVMNFAEDHPLEAGLEHVALWNSAFVKSDDCIQAMSGFLTKRAPVYRNHVLPQALEDDPLGNNEKQC